MVSSEGAPLEYKIQLGCNPVKLTTGAASDFSEQAKRSGTHTAVLGPPAVSIRPLATLPQQANGGT